MVSVDVKNQQVSKHGALTSTETIRLIRDGPKQQERKKEEGLVVGLGDYHMRPSLSLSLSLSHTVL